MIKRSFSTLKAQSNVKIEKAIKIKPFYLLRDNEKVPDNYPQFMVGYKNGFLPRSNPVKDLPLRFSKLDQIMREMPINLPNGAKGLLGELNLG